MSMTYFSCKACSKTWKDVCAVGKFTKNHKCEHYQSKEKPEKKPDKPARMIPANQRRFIDLELIW